MKILSLKKMSILLGALMLSACDGGSPTEPASLFGTDIVEARVAQETFSIMEGQTANVPLTLSRKTKVKALITWEIRGGIGRFLRPTGVMPIEAEVNSVTIPLETFRNDVIEAPSDFEVVINSDSFALPVTVMVSVTDPTLPAKLKFMGTSPLALPTSAVNTQVSGTLTLKNTGEVSARAISASAFTDSQIYFLGGSYPGSGGTCTTVLATGSSCTIVVAGKMTSAGSLTETLTLTYNSGISTDTESMNVRAASDSVIATLTGLPNSTSKDASLNITVGGSSIVNYKYKVGVGTIDCSVATGYLDPAAPSTATNLAASLAGIPDGSMRLCVVGINGLGVQQMFTAATVYNWLKDTTPPEIQGTGPNYDGTLVINGGALRTNVNSVTLTMDTNGSQFMYITNTPGCNSGGVWEIYDDTKPWTLTFGNNTNRIYAKFRDSLGNQTACVNAAIIHDDTPPSVMVNQDVAQDDPTLAAPITYMVDFSEEINQGTFIPEAVEQTGSANTITWKITKMTATQYKLEATSVGVGGTIIPRIKPGVVQDLAGNASAVSTSIDASVTYNLIEFYFKSMSLGSEQSCGFANDGKLYCWGSNANYQLGMGPPEAPPAGYTTPHLIDYSQLAGVRFKKIDVGDISSCAIGNNNKLYCWGKGDRFTNGQYDYDGGTVTYSPIDQVTPAEILYRNYQYYSCGYYGMPVTASTFIDVSVGKNHVCAIDSTFGINCFGQVPQRSLREGMATCVEWNSKPGGKNFKELSSGTFGTCGLDAQGRIYCFGFNEQGQLGNATNTHSGVLVLVNTAGLTNFDGFFQVSSGDDHSCAVGTNGRVYCWGRNQEGQLGNGTFADRNVPTQIDTTSLGAISFAEVRAGKAHTCARTTQGRVYCWGEATNGKLGNAFATNQNAPTLVVTATGNFENVVSLDVGQNHSCGLLANGKMFCWGAQGADGRLGNNSTVMANRPTVVDVNGLLSKRTLVSVSAGTDNTCAVGSDGKVYCWGAGSTGKLGDGVTDRMIPREINNVLVGGQQFTQVSTGRGHSCGLTTSGKAYCWGQNNEGQIGDGTTNASVTPVEVDVNVPGLNDPGTPENEFMGFKSISVGHSHTCALHADGKAFCWGYGLFGQLGSSSILSQSRPQPVNTTAVARFAQLDTGDHHTCGISSAGKAYCWGWGSLGRLGDNSTTDRLIPTLVNTTLNSDIATNTQELFASISAGSEHTCATTVGLKMYCWGNGTEGRLGNFDGTNSTKLTPATVDMTAMGPYFMVERIDSGKEHSCLTTFNGKAACWGTGTKGRVGVGDFLFKSRPNFVNFTGASSYGGSFGISAGGAHTCGLGILGDQYCWGEGLSGRLGNSATDNQGVPVNIQFP